MGNYKLYFSHGTTNSCGVLAGFYGNISVVIKKHFNDKNGRVLILEVTIDDTEYLNIYNENTEKHQLETLQNLSILLEYFDNLYNKNGILMVTLISFSIKSSNVKGEGKFFKRNQ